MTPLKNRPTFRFLSPDWWLNDKNGVRVIGQFPNPALVVWLLALMAHTWSKEALQSEALLHISQGAAIVWALDELLRGVNPFRRLLGAVVLVWQCVGLCG